MRPKNFQGPAPHAPTEPSSSPEEGSPPRACSGPLPPTSGGHSPTCPSNMTRGVRSHIDVGNTLEAPAWRLHRFASALRLTSLVGAGKRGKRLVELCFYDLDRSGLSADAVTAIVGEACSWANAALLPDEMAALARSLSKTARVPLEERELRGIDVRPAGRVPFEVKTALVHVEADGLSFVISCLRDRNNEPRAIPAHERRGQCLRFYQWVQSIDLDGLTFSQVVAAARSAGFHLHTYCAMD